MSKKGSRHRGSRRTRVNKRKMLCSVCGKAGHEANGCFDTHPELLAIYRAERDAKRAARENGINAKSGVVLQRDDAFTATPFAVFTDLPFEMVFKIVGYCGEKEINSIAQQNSILYKWLNPVLYKTNIKTGGSSALFWAAYKGILGTIKLLVTYGVDLHLATSPSNTYLTEEPDEWNWDRRECNGTALHVAIKYGHFDIVDFFIKEGFDTEQKITSTYRTSEINSMELAIKHGNASMGMFLIRKGFGANLENGLRQEAFHSALSSSGLRISFAQQLLFLQILLNSGADVNIPEVPTDWGGLAPYTSLDTVCQYAKWAFPERMQLVLDMLFENGVNIHEKLMYHEQSTVLHMASLLGHTDTVKYLLEHGADIEAEDRHGRTPLAYATAMSGVKEITPMHEEECWRWQLQCIAPLFSQEYRERRRVDTLRWSGSVETVNLLLEHGADPNVMARYCGGKFELTPQMLAEQNKNLSFKVAFANGLESKKVQNTENEADDQDVEEEEQNGAEHSPTETADDHEVSTSLFGGQESTAT